MPPLDIARTWHPDYLVRWLFNQDDIWITAKGEVVQVEAMAPEHALNTLCFLERVADDFPFGRDTLQSKPLYEAIRKRVLDILVPPPPELFVAQQRPGRASWGVYRVFADGVSIAWDYPLANERVARDRARRLNLYEASRR